MNRTLILANPVAGNGKVAKLLPQILDYCKSHSIEHDYKVSECRGHLTKLASEIPRDYDIVISAGGDGTINEIINGWQFNNKTMLAVLPIGSGNDFPRNVGMNGSLTANLDSIFAPNRKTSSVDIGKLEYRTNGFETFTSRLFINSMGIGFDAQVASINQNHKALKGISGYILSVLKSLISMKVLEIDAEIDGIKVNGRKLIVTVANSKTTGGGFYLTPNAEIDDNVFDIALVDDVSRMTLLQKLPLAILNKTDKVKEITVHKVKSCKISIKDGYFLHTDGELLSDKANYVEISILPEKIKVITRQPK